MERAESREKTDVHFQRALMRGNDSHRLDGLQGGATRQFAW